MGNRLINIYFKRIVFIFGSLLLVNNAYAYNDDECNQDWIFTTSANTSVFHMKTCVNSSGGSGFSVAINLTDTKIDVCWTLVFANGTVDKACSSNLKPNVTPGEEPHSSCFRCAPKNSGGVVNVILRSFKISGTNVNIDTSPTPNTTPNPNPTISLEEIIFNELELKYPMYLSPQSHTEKKGEYFYRYYTSSVKYVAIGINSHEIWYFYNDEWFYFSTLEEANVLLCSSGGCSANESIDPASGDNLYGSIAYDAYNGATGYSWRFSDKESADNGALEKCKKYGNNCSIITSFSNTCAALADSDTYHAWTINSSRSLAEQDVVNKCNTFSSSACVLRISVCTDQ